MTQSMRDEAPGSRASIAGWLVLAVVVIVLAGVHVALVSGRGANDARRLVGVANVWVVGNHGAGKLDHDLGWARLTTWGLFSKIDNDLLKHADDGIARIA